MPPMLPSKRCGRLELLDELGHVEPLGILEPLAEPDLGQGAANQITGPPQVPLQQCPHAAANADIPRLDHFECDDRGIEQVAHFMRQETGALVASRCLAIERGLILRAAELSDRPRDGVVETLH